MKISGAPRVAHRVGRSSQATPAAVDNSAPLQTRPPSLIYRGWTVQTNRATSVCIRFGNPPDSRSIAKFIATNRRLLVASGEYLKRCGVPRTPAELKQHNCIGIRQGDEGYGVWRFQTVKSKGKTLETMTAKVRGNLTTNDGGVAVTWALDGHGILLRAEWDVKKYLDSGQLVQILRDYQSPDADIYAVYSERHRTSLRVKTFVEFVSTKFAASECQQRLRGARCV